MRLFKTGKILGQGSYAVVRLCTENFTDKVFAVKIYEKYKLLEPHRRKNLKREILILNKLNHKNIIKLYKTIETSR